MFSFSQVRIVAKRVLLLSVVISFVIYVLHLNKKTSRFDIIKRVLVENVSDDMLNYKNNYLYYENVNLNSLAKRYNTPLMFIQKQR